MYLNVEEVDTAVVNLATAYPALCTLITLPNTTFETRTCHALRLGGGAAGSRDCVTIIGGQHAREWGSCEILVGLAADLLDAYTNNTGLAYGGKSFTAVQIQTLLNGLHLIVFPLVNPDGRAYSQLHDPVQGDAGWRKNRNPANNGGNHACDGVDLNRNYDFLFDLSKFAPGALGVYTSANPCDITYQGPTPFSEPETQNVRWLLDTNPRTRWFIDVHSYQQDILYSWGDDEDQSTTAAMNFANAAYDGQRGLAGDAYGEYLHADDHAVVVALATKFQTGLNAVRGTTYAVKSSYALYATAGSSDDYSYARHLVDPSKGKVYSFVIEWGTEFRPLWPEMQNIVADVDAGLIEFCLAAPCAAGLTAVGLDTQAIVFEAVPAGVETTRAAVFSVQTCGAVDLNVVPPTPTVLSGPGAFGLPVGNASLPAADTAAERDVRLWISFTGTSAGDATTGTVTVHCPQTNQDFVIPITAHTIAQPKVASMLVLDRSGSMDDPSGIPGMKRIDVLHAAAPGYPALLPDNAGIGIVSFDQDAHAVMPLETAGGAGTGRADAIAKIAAHATNPLGSTSIGDGVQLAHDTLAPLAASYDSTAVVVFTDGEENTAKFIANLPAAVLNDRVFAIALGTADETNPVALNELVGKTGGYLLLTDALGPNDQFRLAKYFVQIVAGVTNAEIVVDPQGEVFPGLEVRIPFDLVESDYGADAIVLSPFPSALRFQLETPAGERIDHTALGGIAGVHFSAYPQLAFYRLSLPVVVKGTGAARGRWHVVLGIGKEQSTTAASARRGIPYSVVVHARSALNMDVFLTQPSYVAPTVLHLRAVLTEIGLPLDHRAHVRAEIARPDGTHTVVALAETEPGIFEATAAAPLNGVYPVRFRANGTSLRGFPFTREETRTGLAWRGGNAPPPHAPPANHEWCDLIRCLLADDGIRRWFETQKIDPKTLTRCIDAACPK